MKTNYNLWLKDNNQFQFISDTKKIFTQHEKISYCRTHILKRWQFELVLIDCNAHYQHSIARHGNIIKLETPYGKAWYQAL